MAKGKKGGIPHPHLDMPKNMPGDMSNPSTKKKFGGKGRLKPHTGHDSGGGFAGDKHGLHGASVKEPKLTPKSKKGK